MKAVGYIESLPASNPNSLFDFELPTPTPGPRDLLVEVRAVSVNPVDAKVRMRSAGQAGAPRVLGFDCAGVVAAVGSEVSLFRVGDEVFYAGSIQRPGTNSEFHVVDERIVGPKPRSISFAASAALPLTSITAWELLFDRLRVPREKPGAGMLLVIGAGGGVGSILVQLARQLTSLTIIGTASRAASAKWILSLGAHHSIDHSRELGDELARIGIGGVDYVASLTHTGEHFEEIVQVLAPQGAVGIIDDPEPIDVRLLKAKSASLHWEFMFARSSFQTPDMIEQHRILSAISTCVDIWKIRSTLASAGGRINAENLRYAHQQIESHSSIGKIVLEGF